MRYLPFISALLCSALIVPSHASDLKIDKPTSQSISPHKALYEIKLESARSSAAIANVSGQMFYEWTNDCDAWSTNHSFNLVYEYTDSPSLRITSDFSTFESYDGKTLNYTSQRKQDGKLFEEIRGQAVLNESGAGSANFSIPKELVYDLKEGSLFPMAHTIATVEKMKQGKKFYNASIFDGSDDDGPTEVNAFIGKPIAPIKVNAIAENLGSAVNAGLLSSPAHEIRMAFFPLADESPTSDYEMVITLHENSVISDMRIEYDDFTVSQKLIALEPLDSVCKNKTPEK